MLKNTTKIITIFLIAILFLGPSVVLSDNELTENAVVDEDNYKKSDVYIIDKDVNIDYIVDGNVFAIGDNVTINSQIGGDAFIMAKHVVIDEKGYVFSNLFVMAETIEIKGIVYDVYGLANNIDIANGYVYRDIKALCNTLTINGSIGRNVFASCENIQFNTDGGSSGLIYGNLEYSAKSEIAIPENGVSGNIEFSEDSTEEKSIQSIIVNYILDLGQFIAFVIIIWLICIWLAPKFLSNTNQYVGKKSLEICGFGLLALIAVPIVCVILLLLQLTAGVSIVLFTAYTLAVILSKSLFTITTNNYVCSKLNISKKSGIFGTLIISSIIVWALTKIPFIGGLISFIIVVLGLGILVNTIIPKK